MQSILLEIIRVALRWVIAGLAAFGAPEPLVQVIGDDATAQWLSILIIGAVTEGGWLAAKYRQWRGVA
jgi:hypothetical protein